MSPEEVQRFTLFNEAIDGPLHRMLLHFENSTEFGSTAVILLNEDGLGLQKYLPFLVGQTFVEASCATPLERVLRVADFPEPGFTDLKPEKDQHISAWTVLARSHDLLITQKSVPRAASRAVELPLAIGIIITGKQNLVNNKVVRAEMLSKDVPTPFITDAWGDSYNDSYILEPRIIESVPQTVFTAVESIMAAAKLAFVAKKYEVAASKYRKAFHYCHKYYPESLESDDLATATDLKRRSLLNLALSSTLVNAKPWLEDAIEAADFLLEMPEATSIDRAKALNRRGRARLALGDDEAAESDLQRSLTLRDDASTKKALEECNVARKRRIASLQKRMRAAFR